MRRKLIARGNVRRGDYIRAVITDTLPEEVPIIFSNDGFYKNQSAATSIDPQAAAFVEAILSPEHSYTKPYRYSVIKDSNSARGLSLIHPSAQIGVADFYKKFDSLICYYSSKSSGSLRYPYKVASTFFVKGPSSGRNEYRGGDVDTVTLDTTVSNPASYFAYNRHSRAHEFFDSNDYMHLEKRFSIFRTLDVGRCFNSIYTHTLFWAVADVETAKDSIHSAGFANEFDRLMQSMNYNETNGICIGPEISRVFAELIFSEIDKRIINKLKDRKLEFKNHYEFRRYVDDFYVFAQNETVADRVTAMVQTCLGDFNLHLNEHKTVTIKRPFATKKSQIISDTNTAVTEFFRKFLETRTSGDSVALYPKRILRSDALIRSLVSSIKAICTLHSTSYETVSDYIVAAAWRRVSELCGGCTNINGERDDEERYVAAIMLLVEVIYFYYTVNPTVRASLNVARSIVASTRLFRTLWPERLPFLAESIVRWTLDLSKSIRRSDKHKDLTAVPVEVLNILLPMKEIAEAEPLVDDLIDSICASVDSFEYFEVISFLFMAGRSSRHRALIDNLFDRAKAIVDRGLGPRTDSQSAHLCLDLLTCPYIQLERRAAWYNNLRLACGLPVLTRSNAQASVSSMEAHPWFVSWGKVDLLRLLRKKELSNVY